MKRAASALLILLRESLQAQKTFYAAQLVDQEFAAAGKHADQLLDLKDY
jgi:hypothetical protein